MMGTPDVYVKPRNKPIKKNTYNKEYCDGFRLVTYFCQKYGIGFVPYRCVGGYYRACSLKYLDYSPYSEIGGIHIICRLPEDEQSLLVFLHELGHHTSDQNGDQLHKEFNTWVHAFKRFRKLGYILTQEGYNFCANAIMSYIIGYAPKQQRTKFYMLWRKVCKLTDFQPSWQLNVNSNNTYAPVWKMKHKQWQKGKRYA